MRTATLVLTSSVLIGGAVLSSATDPLRRAADVSTWDEVLQGPSVATPAPEDAEGPGTLVVDLLDGTDAAARDALEVRLGGADLTWAHPLAADEALAVVTVDDLGAAMEALRDAPQVEAVEPLLTFGLGPSARSALPPVTPSSTGYPDDPLYEAQWHLRAMGAPAGWWSTPSGDGVVVAVLDTGLAPVPDLQGTRVLEGFSLVPGVDVSLDGNGHGTHVAGTIAQTTHNALGVAGVAPRATILPVKVLSDLGGGTSAQVAAGIDAAVDAGADVINLSLGGPRYSKVIHTAVRKAREAGVLVIAAAGNDGRARVSWPGALREVVGVGAVGPDGRRAPYSNHGLGVDLVAPGGDTRVEGGGVLQDTVDGEGGHAYRALQGTSMATPHVSGAAAALLSTGLYSPRDVERALLAGADGAVWTPHLGWGRLDLAGSLALLGQGGANGRGALGLVFGVLLGGLAGRGLSWRVGAGLLGGASAGGLLGGLAWAGSGWGWGLLTHGVLSWPVLMVGPWWGQLPAWGAAFGLVLLASVLGLSRGGRLVVVGLGSGLAAHLLYGVAFGRLVPWWFPGSLGTGWMVGQALGCVLVAAAAAGLERATRPS